MLHIVTALPSEAKPLIQHYALNGRQPENGFRIYENEEIRLIVSGIGKCAAAAACAYLQCMDVNTKHTWLNLGIAGHATLDVGEAVLAHKITDTATGNRWYPSMPFKRPCQSLELITRDQSKANYDANAVIDMEASGFYATAIRFNSSELVQILKVISDNQTNPAANVNATLAEELINAKLDIVDQIIQQLQQLDNNPNQKNSVEIQQQFMKRWRFTISQQHQLLKLIQRWQAKEMPPLSLENFNNAKNSKALLNQLATQIEAAPLRFTEA